LDHDFKKIGYVVPPTQAIFEILENLCYHTLANMWNQEKYVLDAMQYFFSHIFQCGFHDKNYYNVSSYTFFVIENIIGCVHINMSQPCHLGECLF
jgi:hypothetical protein